MSTLLPPRPGTCPACAVEHEPDVPHDAQSMYYQMRFRAAHGRWPTWADAVAHCKANVAALWKGELQKRGAWSEPPGEPVPEDPRRMTPGLVEMPESRPVVIQMEYPDDADDTDEDD